jgi:hypothetical protein
MKSLFTLFLALFLVMPYAEAAKKKSHKRTYSKAKKSAVVKKTLTDARKNKYKEKKLYFGKDSTEVIMTFAGKLRREGQLIDNAANRTAMLEIINDQVEHLYGPMSAGQFKAVPRGNHKINDVRIIPEANGTLITYKYSGTAVVANGAGDKYDVVLPVNPDKVYKAGFTPQSSINHCTDHHYQDEGDFWYFWNPANDECPLQKDKDYYVITAQLQRIPNTKLTFPEYERLVDQKGQITISLLMGMDDPDNGRDPYSSQDINASNYRDIANTLKRGGYQARKWTSREIDLIAKKKSRKGVFVEEFTKDVTNRSTNKKTKIVMRMFFGPSGIDEDSSSFHFFFKDALENQAIMMYDGHSGLGGHLDLDSIEEEIGELKPNPNRYQIYYFNSCTSYSYYNTMYFGPKASAQDPKGTKNLDIITNGLATYFSVMHATNFGVVEAVEAFASGAAKISYQAIANKIDSDNLLGINGDEDNPTR